MRKRGASGYFFLHISYDESCGGFRQLKDYIHYILYITVYYIGGTFSFKDFFP